jgi:hypothetical protein
VESYDNWYFDDFIEKFLKCRYEVLSEFVHYSNEFLSQLYKSKWCAKKKQISKVNINKVLPPKGFKTSERDTREYHSCTPPTKREFRQLCSSHHLALQFSDEGYHLLLEGKKRRRKHVKFLRLFRSSYKLPCRVTTTRNAVTQSFEYDYNDDVFEMEYSLLEDDDMLSYCMQELCNFLDVYCLPSYFNDLVLISFQRR